MECRLLFEHLMCDAFCCNRAEFSFANTDFYDAGVTKHPETKAYIVCALIALAYKKCVGTRRDELLEIAKQVDDMQKVTDTDINILLDELNDKGFVY